MKGVIMSRKFLLIALAVLLIIPVMVIAGKDKQSDVWLGIYTQTVDKDLKEAFNLNVDYGVIVKSVIPDSPADEAGLKQGDIILKFAGKKVRNADELVESVSQHKAGDKIDIVLIRDGDKKTLVVELDNRDDHDSYAKAYNNYNKALQWFDKNGPKSYSWQYQRDDSKYSDTYIGLSLQNLNSQFGEYFGVEDGRGALITEVLAESPAEKAGLKAGDVIIEIDGNKVEGPNDVQEAVQEADEGDEIEVAVLRDKAEKTFKLEVAEAPDNFYSTPNMMKPDFDNNYLFIPRTKGLFRGNSDNDVFDAQDMQEWREGIEQELKELQEELKDLKNKLE